MLSRKDYTVRRGRSATGPAPATQHATSEAPGVDVGRLRAWLDQRGLGGGAIGEVELLAGGTQNIVVRFQRGGRTFVLRRGPLHKRASSDEAMRREATVLRSLAATQVPHPRLIDSCGDPDVIGSAFYLTEYVDGANPRDGLPAGYRDSLAARRQVGFAFADAAAAIGAVDHVAIGLAALGRPAGFLERQVPRWTALFESYASTPGYRAERRAAEIGDVGRWLEDRRPAGFRPGLMHGDFHLWNVMVGPAAPVIAAVVDWELATIGDPLLDLGWMLATWPCPDGGGAHAIGFAPWEGMPTAPEVVERYADRTDRDLAHVRWYEVLAAFKLGIILEGTYARSLGDEAPADVGREMHERSVALLARARSRIG
jgi:aminoglycoside phosphotransferase (APT) family kinase protein